MTARSLLLYTAPFFLLSACGFQPMYGSAANAPSVSGSTTEAGLDQVEIANIRDAQGVFLRNALIDRFYRHGYPSNPRYELQFGPITETKVNLDITTSSETTRSQLYQTTTLTLFDRQSGSSKPVLSRPLASSSSYNVLESEYATRVSEQSARESSLEDIARQAELQISLFLNRKPDSPGTP